MTIEKLKQSVIVQDYLEVIRPQTETLMKDMLAPVGLPFDQEEFVKLVDDMIETTLYSIDLAFDSQEDFEDFCQTQLKYKESIALLHDLSKKKMQDSLTEERLLKLFNIEE